MDSYTRHPEFDPLGREKQKNRRVESTSTSHNAQLVSDNCTTVHFSLPGYRYTNVYRPISFSGILTAILERIRQWHTCRPTNPPLIIFHGLVASFIILHKLSQRVVAAWSLVTPLQGRSSNKYTYKVYKFFAA
jgi:hypothetical protein